MASQNLTPEPTTSSDSTPSHFKKSQSSFSWQKNEEFEFIVPEEAPIYRPTEAEFENPLQFINKIRPEAEKYGICKIVPPQNWKPPFTVDVENLRFTPRIQRLNELEAKTRIKLNFLDQIAKFWELQGSSLKIPMVERKALDLHLLHRIVQDEGGMEQTSKDRKWSHVAARMKYPPGKCVGTILKQHYERILFPFDIYISGKAVDTTKLETQYDDQDYKPHEIETRQKVTPPKETTARRSKRFSANNTPTKSEQCGGDDDDVKPIDVKRISMSLTKQEIKSRMFGKRRDSRRRSNKDPLAKYICNICNRGDVEDAMLLCDGCDDSYHTFCLLPPLNDIPKGDWRCPKCVVEEVSKPIEAFGFEQAQREYTLHQFGDMADQFKLEYFNMPVYSVPVEMVEREFWRIVSSIDEDVTVEYGADLHTMDHGSGFPTKKTLNMLKADKEYADSAWNLNNLPVQEESILGYINADISGMKVPWMYVGMCFSAFCWHNEDHWSYSINYLHWGEPKTWYGVPGSQAEAFEETMKSAAPELFHSQPDLLHQLVTIMNPNILTKAGVPVYRIDQNATEFVVTFPRAYHAGFNQGYNFAEAVNFAPADWIKMGRECINHYSTLRRYCVFSHDEIVCKMAAQHDNLNLGMATACYIDMVDMVDSEKKLRKSLLEWGVTRAERRVFELIPDDERQCEICKTTIFLSAVSCPCNNNLACLRHYSELCKCLPEKHTLLYRYTLDELPSMLRTLKIKAEAFELWLSKVRDVVDLNKPTTITLDELKELTNEAEKYKFPNSAVLDRLNSAVIEAEKCVTVILQLDINKMRTRTRNSNESIKYKLTLEELDLFVQEIDTLYCIIQEGESVRQLQQYGKDYVEQAAKLLQTSLSKVDEIAIERLIDDGSSLCIELPQIVALKDRLAQVHWLNCCRDARESNDKISLENIKKIMADGLKVTPNIIIEKELVELQQIVLTVEEWESEAQQCFERGTEHQIPEIEELLIKAENIEGNLPSYQNLKDAMKKAKEWLSTVEILKANENYPYFHTLENVVNRGKNIPLQLGELKRMDEHLSSAREWKERTCKSFFKKHTSFTLMDALSPRSDAVMKVCRVKKAKLNDESFLKQFTEEMTPVKMVIAFKSAEEKEMEDMKSLRRLNQIKNPEEDKYCSCRRRFYGLMYHCQLCKDWFHAGCVPPPKSVVRLRPVNSPPSTPVVPLLNKREKDLEPKYLCPSCMRSRRPRLETILSLLVSLQRLPIRIPEGEALQCLTERAMNWQDRARQTFNSGEIETALKKLTIVAQKTSTPAAIVPPTVVTKNTTNDLSSESSSDGDVGFDITEGNMSPSSTKIEHAYSSPPPNFSNYKHGNQVQKPDPPLVFLSKAAKDHLEVLMMEGDLLEVSLDETNDIWRILNSTRPGFSDLAFIHFTYKILPHPNEMIVNVKKRKSGDELVKKLAKIPKPIIEGTVATTAAGTSSIETSENLATMSSPSKINKRGRKMKMIPKDEDENSNTAIAATAITTTTTINSTAPLVIDFPKKKKEIGSIKKMKRKNNTSNKSESGDEDEECEAKNCIRPGGREVDWVQCDGDCNKWFHMFCVGLSKSQIKPDDDFVCNICKKIDVDES